MKHYEMPSVTTCRIYGHSDTRWVPVEGPLALLKKESERPAALVCLACKETIERST